MTPDPQIPQSISSDLEHFFDVCEAFDFFSKSKRRKAGHVTGADLREILTQYGEDTFTKEDAEERISSIPGVNSGTLDREVDIRSFVESTMF